MKRSVSGMLMLLLLLWPLLAGADQKSGSITTNGQCLSLQVTPTSNGTVQISGTWTGTISATARVGTATAVALPLTPLAGGAAVTSTTGNGTWTWGQAFTIVNFCATASMTGTAVIDVLSSASRSTPPGTAASSLSNPVTPAQGGTGGDFSSSTGVLYDAAGTFSAIACTSGVFQGGAPPTCTTTPALGTPASGVATNLTGTAAGLTAGLATDTVSKTGSGSVYATQSAPALTNPNLITATLTTSVAGTPTWLSTQSLNTSGNAGTASVLTPGRTINGTAFDGSANITVPAASSSGPFVVGSYVEIPEQAAPGTPTNAARLFVDTSNRFSWKGENGFVRTFDGTGNSADRVYVLPDAAGTVVLDTATQTLTGKTLTAPTITGGTHTAITSFGLRDTGAAFDLVFQATGTGTSAPRTLTLDMRNVAHTLSFGTVANSITFPDAASGIVPFLNLAQTFTAAQGINLNAAALPADIAGVSQALHLGGADTLSSVLLLDSAAAAGNLTFRRSGGTFATPTATAAAATIGSIQARGYETVSPAYTGAKAAISFLSVSAWTNVDNSTQIVMSTTPVGGVALATALTIGSDKSLTVAGQIFVTAMTQTSAAQTGTVCYNSGTGAVNYDATLGCLASTMRVKERWRPLDRAEALATVNRLEAGAFYYRESYKPGQGEQVGLQAEQVDRVDTRLVGYDGEGKPLGVKYREYTAVLTAAIQALTGENHSLRARVEALERR